MPAYLRHPVNVYFCLPAWDGSLRRLPGRNALSAEWEAQGAQPPKTDLLKQPCPPSYFSPGSGLVFWGFPLQNPKASTGLAIRSWSLEAGSQQPVDGPPITVDEAHKFPVFPSRPWKLPGRCY